MVRRLVTVPLVLLALVPMAWAAEQNLTKRQATTLKEGVVPAYRAGDHLSVLKALSPLIAELSEDRLKAADELLAAEKVPNVAELLTETRLELVSQDSRAKVPAPRPREAALVAVGLKAGIERLLDEAGKHPALAFTLPKPADFDAYRQLFWSIHVLENQMQTARNVVSYAPGLSKLISAKLLEQLPDAQREAVETDWQVVGTDLETIRQALEEREAELRMQRLDVALEKLAPRQAARDRFLAADALEQDSRLLAEYYARRDQARVAEIKEKFERGQKLGGDVIVKGRLLFAGLHWWLRGRYGHGPEMAGLVKTEDAARPQTYFALHMPSETPKPTDPFNNAERIPTYERRHHYLWRYAPREMHYSTEVSERVGGRTGFGFTVKFKGFM